MNLICISCPRGCHLEVNKVGSEVVVKGNSCPRGEIYARNELLDPKRTLTTTVAIESSSCRRLPVISSVPLPKGKVVDACRALKDVRVKAPVHLGDVIVKGVLGLDVDIVASKSIEK